MRTETKIRIARSFVRYVVASSVAGATSRTFSSNGMEDDSPLQKMQIAIGSITLGAIAGQYAANYVDNALCTILDPDTSGTTEDTPTP